MTNEKYNGWINYETWNVALWLDNDEPMYNTIQAMVKRTAAHGGTAYTLAVKIKRYVSRQFRDNGNTFGDLDKVSEFRRVHFKEIAKNLLSEYQLEIEANKADQK